MPSPITPRTAKSTVSGGLGYYPFGMMQEGRQFVRGMGYRWGFNCQEMDNEVFGVGLAYYLQSREYVASLGRMFSIDPRTTEYPWQSPYVYHRNCPIASIDYLGAGDPGEKQGTYRIKKGDTFWDLARKSGGAYSVGDLKSWNPNVEPTKLRIGQIINIADPVQADMDNAISNRNSVIPFVKGDYKIRDKDFPLVNGLPGLAYNKPSLFWEFEHGGGPKNSILPSDHFATIELRQFNNEVNRLRYLVYNKFSGDISKMSEYASSNDRFLYSNFSGYRGGFRPQYERAGPSQFIGSFSGDVFLSWDNKSLLFVITDSKSVYSLLYHVTGRLNRERDPNKRTPYGNTYQKYIWVEPINLNFWHNEKGRRDENGNLL
jgi:RHS repeat-associated protein